MDSDSPIKKRNSSKFTGTRINPVMKSTPSTPAHKFASFDTTWFQRNLVAPSKLQILILLLLTIIVGMGLITSMKPARFCEFAGDTKCRKCPNYAVCTSDSFSCVAPAVENNGFCAVIGSEEYDALTILPKIRDRTPDQIDRALAKDLGVSTNILEKAFSFAQEEDRGGLKTTSAKFLLGLFVGLLFLLLNRLYVRCRAISEHNKVMTMVGQIERTSGTPISMKDLCRRCNVQVTPESRGRMFRELSLHPHLDADPATQTIRRV